MGQMAEESTTPTRGALSGALLHLRYPERVDTKVAQDHRFMHTVSNRVWSDRVRGHQLRAWRYRRGATDRRESMVVITTKIVVTATAEITATASIKINTRIKIKVKFTTSAIETRPPRDAGPAKPWRHVSCSEARRQRVVRSRTHHHKECAL